MKKDVALKRGKFIGKVNSILQELHFADPTILVKLLQVYCTSFYGSCLWDLYSAKIDRLYRSWNVSVRNIFQVPYNTHRYLVQPLTDSSHPKTMLSRRFAKFMPSLVCSTKSSISYLARLVRYDNRTLAGRTVSRLSRECKVDRGSLTVSTINKAVRYFPVPEGELWRIDITKELLNVKRGCLTVGDFDYLEIEQMINFLCVS